MSRSGCNAEDQQSPYLQKEGTFVEDLLVHIELFKKTEHTYEVYR